MAKTQFILEKDILKAKVIRLRLKNDFLPAIQKLLTNYGADNERRVFLIQSKNKVDKAIDLIERVFFGKSYDIKDFEKLNQILPSLDEIGTTLQQYVEADSYFASIVNALDETDDLINVIKHLNLNVELSVREKAESSKKESLLSRIGKSLRFGTKGIISGGLLSQIAAPVAGPYYATAAAGLATGIGLYKGVKSFFGKEKSREDVGGISTGRVSDIVPLNNLTGGALGKSIISEQSLYKFFDKEAFTAGWTRDVLKTLKDISETKSEEKNKNWFSFLKDVPVFGKLISGLLPILGKLTPAFETVLSGLALVGSALLGWKAGEIINEKLIEPLRKETPGSAGMKVLPIEEDIASYVSKISSKKSTGEKLKYVGERYIKGNFGSWDRIAQFIATMGVSSNWNTFRDDENPMLKESTSAHQAYLDMQEKRKKIGKAYWENNVFHEASASSVSTDLLSIVQDSNTKSYEVLKNIEGELKKKINPAPSTMQPPFDLSDPLLNALNTIGEYNRW